MKTLKQLQAEALEFYTTKIDPYFDCSATKSEIKALFKKVEYLQELQETYSDCAQFCEILKNIEKEIKK